MSCFINFNPQINETMFIIVRHGENEANVARKYDGKDA